MEKDPSANMTVHELFRRFAVQVSIFIGSLWALLMLMIAVCVSGYIYDFSLRWASVTGFFLSVVTLLALIFLQKSQNHNDRATHLKLDELIHASKHARDEFASIEKAPETEIYSLSESPAPKRSGKPREMSEPEQEHE
jgi:low affinity Fe/Cu permease